MWYVKNNASFPVSPVVERHNQCTTVVIGQFHTTLYKIMWISTQCLTQSTQYVTILPCHQVIFVWQCVEWSGLSLGDYKYPLWSEFVGWGLCLCSILCVPGYALYRLLTDDKSLPLKEVRRSSNQFLSMLLSERCKPFSVDIIKTAFCTSKTSNKQCWYS